MSIGPVSLSRNHKIRYKYLGRVGKVISFTSIAVAPTGLNKRVPYMVAVVDFGEEQATVPLIDIGVSGIKAGVKVVGVLRKMFEPTESGIITYGVKCVPLEIVRSKE